MFDCQIFGIDVSLWNRNKNQISIHLVLWKIDFLCKINSNSKKVCFKLSFKQTMCTVNKAHTQSKSRSSATVVIKVIEKCTNFYFGTEKLPPKF